MGCGSFGVTPILVGLHRVGLVGLRQAILDAESAGVTDRDEVVDRLLATLADDNYLPDAQMGDLRRALWREVLRRRGEDFSEFFSRVEVVVHADAGEERDHFVAMLRSVFADFELEPVVRYEGPADHGVQPVLMAGGQEIVRGMQNRQNLKKLVRRSFTDW